MLRFNTMQDLITKAPFSVFRETYRYEGEYSDDAIVNNDSLLSPLKNFNCVKIIDLDDMLSMSRENRSYIFISSCGRFVFTKISENKSSKPSLIFAEYEYSRKDFNMIPPLQPDCMIFNNFLILQKLSSIDITSHLFSILFDTGIISRGYAAECIMGTSSVKDAFGFKVAVISDNRDCLGSYSDKFLANILEPVDVKLRVAGHTDSGKHIYFYIEGLGRTVLFYVPTGLGKFNSRLMSLVHEYTIQQIMLF